MRIHSNNLTVEKIETALKNAQSNGRVGMTVGFAVLTEHGSRSRSQAFEVQLGSSTCESFRAAGIDGAGYSDKAVKRASRRHSRQWSAGDKDVLKYAPTWHEWGHFIAELFVEDPHALVGGYKGQDSFEYQTDMDSRNYRIIERAFDWDGRAYDFMTDAFDFHRAAMATA